MTFHSNFIQKLWCTGKSNNTPSDNPSTAMQWEKEATNRPLRNLRFIFFLFIAFPSASCVCVVCFWWQRERMMVLQYICASIWWRVKMLFSASSLSTMQMNDKQKNKKEGFSHQWWVFGIRRRTLVQAISPQWKTNETGKLCRDTASPSIVQI